MTRSDTPTTASAIRVVRVFGALDIGGAELRTLELLPSLVAAGIQPHFVTLSGRAGVLADRAMSAGASVHPIKLNVSFIFRFTRLLRRLQAHVVHSDVATFSGAILLLAAAVGVPIRVAHFRSDGDGHPNTIRRNLQRRVMRQLIRRCATHIIGVSPGALSHGYSSDWPSDRRCRVVPNGIDLARLRGGSEVNLRDALAANNDAKIFVHVGRPSPEKRRWLVVTAINELEKRGLIAHAAFIGPRDPADEQRIVTSANAETRASIRFLGPMDAVGCPISQADALILPSDREGLPGVVLEALAVGTPVVASDLPGVRYIAEHLPGVTTVGVDAPAEVWATALQQAARQQVTADDRRKATERFAKGPFSITSAAASHLAIYRSAVPGQAAQ